ncbi:hypothetical protein FRX31_021519 [Thalictrum thalictroides]|uniref:Transposase Tnp1/En/Spm-like domain-containing protein n=1 Tax=Thalictrum thalictroides TaxID=46969 RepID=A0A7J6VWA9_THATH|nr:hypothetical protein FRX31_021519 [Thalictrum thalictroides]
MYKDGHGMPSEFVTRMVHALKKSFIKRTFAGKYITDRIKTVWREWISPPSAAQPAICRGPYMEYTKYLHILIIDGNFNKTRITVDVWGEVNNYKDDRKDLVKAINFHVRRFVPIIYKDTRDLPYPFVQRVMDALEENFSFNDVPMDSYITDLVKAAWSGNKNEWRKNYIKGKDPAIVKESSPSPFVTNEDWAQFVDMCTSTNRKNKVGTANNRCNLTGISSEIKAKEKNIDIDADLEMTEQDSISHDQTKKQKTVHSLKTVSAIQIGSNLSSREFAASSIQPCLTHQLNVGKRCDLLAWGSEVIACGEVVAVDPVLIGDLAPSGEGLYKIAIKKVIISCSLLDRPVGLSKTIGDVGAGGLVVWPRCFLNIHH